MKRGDTTNGTDTDIGQRKQWQANTSDTEKFSLNEATAILRMLTKGKHALFEEDALRRKQWIKDIPSETGDALASGIDGT